MRHDLSLGAQTSVVSLHYDDGGERYIGRLVLSGMQSFASLCLGVIKRSLNDIISPNYGEKRGRNELWIVPCNEHFNPGR